MTFRPQVLLVDDEETTREALGRVLRDKYDCEAVPSVAGGIERLRLLTFDVVIAEVHMAGMGGFELLDWLKRERPTLPALLVSAKGGIQEAVDAMRRGAFHYLTKPCDDAELVTVVDGAVAARRRCAADASDGLGVLSTQGPARANGSFDGRRTPIRAGMELVGSGPAMAALLETIDQVAASSAPVLVTGESGSGKELVSRAIHNRSARRTAPFVAVNTSAIPAELLEAEIFGHVRGGFTGAAQTRKGLVTEASGGTLLLDEIGDMPLGLQAKILRVLQLGEVRPIGSDRAHLVDVRVIAATHRDLAALVREGRFREDLYFRLNVLPVVVPALRERREDIPALALHLLAQARQRSLASPVRSFAPDALEVLSAAPWPGNVRELASVIERLVVFGREEKIEARHLSSLAQSPPSSPPPLLLSAMPTEALWTLRRLTEAYTEQVLAQTGGNKQRAAEILDVDLSTLYRWQRGGKSPRKRARETARDAADKRSSRDTVPPSS